MDLSDVGCATTVHKSTIYIHLLDLAEGKKFHIFLRILEVQMWSPAWMKHLTFRNPKVGEG